MRQPPWRIRPVLRGLPACRRGPARRPRTLPRRPARPGRRRRPASGRSTAAGTVSRRRRRHGTDHREQRHDARAAGDELDRAPTARFVVGPGWAPHEERPQRSVDLDRVADLEIVDEERGDLAVRDLGHDQLHRRRRPGRRDRVGAGRLVPVGSGQPNVQVLAGVVARPGRHVENDPPRGCRLRRGRRDRADVPRGARRSERRRGAADDHQYRSSRQGSPCRW